MLRSFFQRPAPGNASSRAVFVVAASLALAMLLSSAPSALYPMYQQRWQMSAVGLTGAFTAYGVAVLVTLIACGKLADRLRERRWLLVPGLALVVLGALAAAWGDSPAWLYASRILAGLGAGVLTGSANAALLDLLPPASQRRAATLATMAFTSGGALGPVISGIALRLKWAPLTTPYVLIAVLSLAAIVAMVRMPWPAAEADAAPLAETPLRQGVGAAARAPAFVLAAATLTLGWAIVSVFLALGPLMALTYAGISRPSVAGLTVTGFQIAAGATQLLGRSLPRVRLCLIGGVALALALFAAALSAWFVWPWVFVLALLCAGVGYGASFVGAAGLVNHTAPPACRASLVSLFYLLGYIGNAVPVMVIGLAADHIGMRAAVSGFAVLMLAAAAGIVAYARVHPVDA